MGELVGWHCSGVDREGAGCVGGGMKSILIRTQRRCN
jgi:hypothetical protein